MDQRWLILGGYGNTGRQIAELLLRETPLQLVLAGRDPGRASAAADQLNARHGAARVQGRRVDAADAAGLRAALADVDLVVVAASSTEHVARVARAALDAGVDYLDTQLSFPYKHRALAALRGEIEARGLCFISDAGFHPGIPAAMARYAAARFERLLRADVGSVIQMDWGAYSFAASTLPEMIEELKTYRAEVFRDGHWVEKLNETLRLDFGAPFGPRTCYPYPLAEMRQLTEALPSLRHTGFFVAGFNPVTDYLVLPLAVAALKLAPRRAVRPIGALFQWSLQHFSRPPFGVVLAMEAEGTCEGKPARLRLSLAHADGYYLTAAPVVACLKQYRAGPRRPGLWLQGLYVEPEGFFAELARLGVRVEGLREVPAGVG